MNTNVNVIRTELDDGKIDILKTLAKKYPNVLASGLIEKMYFENKFRSLTYKQVQDVFKAMDIELALEKNGIGNYSLECA